MVIAIYAARGSPSSITANSAAVLHGKLITVILSRRVEPTISETFTQYAPTAIGAKEHTATGHIARKVGWTEFSDCKPNRGGNDRMTYQVFVSCSIWPPDTSKIEPFRELVRSTGKVPWTVGIDEKVPDNEVFPVIVRRVRESAAMIVVHTHRYQVNGHLPSVWLQREPIMAALETKPLLEFYETGIREESLLRDVSVNQVEFNEYEFLNDSGRNRIKEWLEHFWWHVDWFYHSWIPLTTAIGTVGGGLATQRLNGALGGGVIGFVGGMILDQLKPVCNFCPRTYPPRFI